MTTLTTPLAVVIAIVGTSLASTLLALRELALELLVDPDFVAAPRSELER